MKAKTGSEQSKIYKQGKRVDLQAVCTDINKTLTYSGIKSAIHVIKYVLSIILPVWSTIFGYISTKLLIEVCFR
jgi:hypothetical protein